MKAHEFKIIISYFVKGELVKLERRVSASSVGMAWRAGISMIPTSSLNQIKIKVDKVR